MERFAAGLAAGAIGTLVLNAVTYADVALRGRPPSTVPADTVQRAADSIGVDLSGDGDEEVAAHRRTALGALSGYATGVALGALYGAVRPALPQMRVPVAGVVLAAVAMVAGNGGAVASGTTDPRRWGFRGWISDVVPHLCFGLATAAAFDGLDHSVSDHSLPAE